MEEKKISVIVPVYGVEAYLDRCVASLVGQTYRNLEILLVDDGSPDRCGAMCDAWAAKDSRIRVIHKENGGLSDARNAGMKEATGELLGFIDSDDWIEPDMYALLAKRLAKDGADIAACGVVMDWEDGTPSRMLTREGSCVLEADEAMEAVVRESWLKQPVWYKLYRTALVGDMFFPVGKYHEDVFWSYRAVGAAGKVTVIDAPCYHYIQRSGSIMGAGYSAKRLDALEAKQQRLAYLEEKKSPVLAAAQEDFLFSCLYHGQMAMEYLRGEEKKKTMAALGAMVKRCPLPGGLSMTHRVWLRMAKACFPAACRVRGGLGIGV